MQCARCGATHRPACVAPSSTTRLMWGIVPDANTTCAKLEGTGAHIHTAVSRAIVPNTSASTGSA